MRPCLLPGTALTIMLFKQNTVFAHGTTLIELVIVVAVMGILLTLALPSYSSYTLRVHRTEAINMLLQASMCQERIYASRGSYDTRLCQHVAEQQRYQISYQPADTQGLTYIVTATPKGAQLADPCGNLSLDQSGVRSISVMNISETKCWNGR